jgi:hypothetical protein
MYVLKERTMDIQEATPEQITAFEKGAADRYAERGVPQDVALQLYARELNKQASTLGLAAKPARIEKVASELAEALGKKRPAKK